VFETVEVATRAPFDPASPQLGQAPRSRWRRLTCKALADQHGERLLDRRVGTVGDLVEFAAMKLIVQHGGKIPADPLHPPRPDPPGPGLLDRLENRSPLLTSRKQAAMNCVIVTGHAQRDRIRVPANDRGVGSCEFARWFRKPRLAGRHPGSLRCERNL